MKHSHRPALLVLTSSFPNSPDDETCGYIRDFARSLSTEFNVTVLAPPDRNATAWRPDRFELHRSRSVLPLAVDPFMAGDDLNRLADAGVLVRVATLVSLACFLWRAIFLALRADVVCSHWMFPSGLVGALICRVLRKPHIVVEHSGAVHLLAKIRGGRSIARFITRSSSRIVAVSADLRTRLIDICPETVDLIQIIPMGVNSTSVSRAQIDAPTTEQQSTSAFTILFIGRLTKIKGVDVLLSVASGLSNVRLIIGGDGECRGELEQLASELSVNASFLGRINASERQHLLSMSDVVVIPSRILSDGRTEGTPVVCLEAMAAGRVVIASRVGGLSEVIIDNKNGLLFDPEDYYELRQKILTILEDKHLRRKIEEEAIRRSANYSWQLTGSRYAELIKKALRYDGVIGNRRIEVSSIN